jgi:class 3 adenylate cyclase
MPRPNGRRTLLLVTLAPAFVVVFGLHVKQALQTGLAQPAFFVATPGPDAYPSVRGFRREQAGGAEMLRIGDRLIRLGDVDLRGVGHIGFDALASRDVAHTRLLSLVIERDARRLPVHAELVALPVPWGRIPALLGAALVAIAVLLRGPQRARPERFYAAFMLFVIQQSPFHGGPIVQTYASKLLFYGLGVVAPSLLLAWLVRFPEERPPPGPLERALPWLFAPVYFFLRLQYFLPGPLPAWVAPLAVPVTDGLLLLTILIVLARSYRRVGAVGRRRIKWVVYGVYLGFVPFMLVTGLVSGLAGRSAYSRALHLSAIPAVLMPLGFLLAIVRQQLFDIDRLISETTAYTLVCVGVVTGALTLIPWAVASVGNALPLDPNLSQGALTLLLAGFVVPTGRRLRPTIDRAFFPERHRLELGMPRLLTDLGSCDSPEELSARVGEGLAVLLRPVSCVVYEPASDAWIPCFLNGSEEGRPLDPADPLVSLLERAKEPLVAGALAGGRRGERVGSSQRAALDALGVAIAVPVRVRDALVVIVTLGEKRSGDLYTATELGWVAAVGERMSVELHRFDDAVRIRRGRELQEAFRRYVPGSVARELVEGGSLDVGEREVTVFFVDIRGYTAIAQDKAAEEVFSLVNRHTELVSGLVLRRGGTVVEFSGDGLMAVFGAPRELEGKEAAAVAAAEDVLEALRSRAAPGGEPIVVGIGIATGAAFVGSIRAEDRYIWSALGTTTNLAARLQQLTRELDAAVVIDLTTWARAGERKTLYERRAATRIRGLTEPRDIWLRPR